MSWLAPLYLAGALTVGIPLWLHWIQRRPKGQRDFSSLLFLSPSPPRSQRRNRLNQLLLLFLRALALCLLALAFARPFLTRLLDTQSSRPERLVAICVDRSASMRRADLWKQAQQELAAAQEKLTPADQVALFVFDRRLELIVPWGPATPDTFGQMRRELQKRQPTFGDTDLGQTLVDLLGAYPTVASAAAESSVSSSNGNNAIGRAGQSDPVAAQRAVILISDLAAGSQLDALDRYRWPPEVHVELRRVATEQPNASMHALLDDEATPAGDDSVRVRVSVDGPTGAEALQLGWQGRGQELSAGQSVQLPAGASRVVRLARVDGSQAIRLQGDAHEFDNLWYLAQPKRTTRTLQFIGSANDLPEELGYYLRRVDLSTPGVDIRLVESPPEQVMQLNLDPHQVPLTIVEGIPTSESLSRWTEYVQRGGRLLLALSSIDETVTPDQIANLSQLLQLPTLSAEPVAADGFVLWSDIDFRDPLFQPFNDPRFSDFSKMRIWNYWRLQIPDGAGVQTLARFDDRSPALLKKELGNGQILVLATSWRPDDSQLALSTKFVPLLAAWMGQTAVSPPVTSVVLVGEPIDLTTAAADAKVTSITRPDGREVPVAAEETSYGDTDEPGIYLLKRAGEELPVAVNIAPDESRTTPLDASELSRRGVTLGEAEDAEKVAATQRALQRHELESQQAWWRWLLAGCLGVLALETYVAGRTDRVAREALA